MADRDVAEKYATGGRTANPYTVKVDDILAVYARPSGYYEAIVRIPEGGLISLNAPRFTFAGQNARTADTHALATALERLDAGEDADTVRQDTGWFIGPDGRARFEISDRDARLKIPTTGKAGEALRGTTTVGALLDHAKLFAAYPGVAAIEVTTKPGAGASFQASHEGHPPRIRIGADMPMGKVTSALMHEIQHYVQRQERFATGSNLLAAGPREAYSNSAGEVEARNVQTRLRMTDEERKGLAPHWTTDVLDQDVIVSFNGKDMAMVPAWHGSPHDFDRFSLDKIGTGEGAQAYGHGLYFAGAKEVAEWYKHNLSGDYTFNGVPYRDLSISIDDPRRSLIEGYDNYIRQGMEPNDAIAALRKSWADVLQTAEGNLKEAESLRGQTVDLGEGWGSLRNFTYTDDVIAEQRAVAERVRNGLSIAKSLRPGDIQQNKGHLYQVELAPSEDEYLLWDKPLSEQSEKVRAALEKAGIVGSSTKKQARTGEDIYRQFTMDAGNPYARMNAWKKGPIGLYPQKESSDYLHSIGIRGIKYLDGTSRGKGDGNYNYVIFNDADVSITAKFSRTGQAFANPMQGASFARAGEFLSDLFNTHGSFGLLKGLKTQYHKATLNPLFRGVWERANAMAMDSARAMSRPADLAPRILPKFDPRNMKEAAKAFVIGRSDVSHTDLKTVSKALSDGTTFGGPSPLKGKAFTDSELAERGLTEKQIGLYNEARAAVDASLDETAAATAWKIVRKTIDDDFLRQRVAENPQDAARILSTKMDYAIAHEVEKLQEMQDGMSEAYDPAAEVKAMESLQKRIAEMRDDAKAIRDIFTKAEQLKDAGYMPLMRFGKYRIGVTMKDDNGETVEYVGRYESHFEANRARRELERQF